MSNSNESTLIMVDDNIDEIFLARRQVRRDGIVNRFVSEQKPENLFSTLDELVAMGVSKESFLILLDVNMPRLDGFEMLGCIRTHPEYRTTPVFMLSVSGDETDIKKAYEKGCDGYLVKPLSADAFFSAIRNVRRMKTKLLQ